MTKNKHAEEETLSYAQRAASRAKTISTTTSTESSSPGSVPLSNVRERKRSKAWVYYTILACALFYFGCTENPSSFIGSGLLALYARYLYRGGRFVLWIW